MVQQADHFLWRVFQRLRAQHLPLGLEEYHALLQALRAGFGWSSRAALRDLCCALWATSRQEQEIIRAVFDELAEYHKIKDWQLAPAGRRGKGQTNTDPEEDGPVRTREQGETAGEEKISTSRLKAGDTGGIPEIVVEQSQLVGRQFVLTPQLPLSQRQIGQELRRLRQMTRSGPPVEIDVETTIERRCQTGITTTVVLAPRRHNIERLLLLVDRLGSMTPFHRLVDEICMVARRLGRFRDVTVRYFHDLPAEGADETLLAPFAQQLMPRLDAILAKIQPLARGYLSIDPELTSRRPLAEVLQAKAPSAAVMILSDAGAARGHYDVRRLLNSVGFLKELRRHTLRMVWLNPLPLTTWNRSTAGQIARHVPMFPIDRDGLHRAVNVLRGRPFVVDKPL